MFLFFIYKGRHCCLFCNTTNANMQPPKSRQDKNSQRALKTLANKLNTFREAGNDLKFAKFHDNVIDDDIILLCANLQQIYQKKNNLSIFILYRLLYLHYTFLWDRISSSLTCWNLDVICLM